MSIIPFSADQAAFLARPKAISSSGMGGAFDAAGTSQARSILPKPSLTQRGQITPYTRTQIVDRFHVVRNNMGVLRHMINRTALGAVGNGISPKATTDDVEWNKESDAYFESIAIKPGLFDFEERRSFYEMQGGVCRDLVGVGESFTNIVSTRGRALPQFQIIPPQFIRNSGKSSAEMIDGLILDAKSSAVRKYNYAPDLNDGTPLSADNIIHVYDIERSMQYRGLPWCYSGINALIDIGDLTALEKAAAKVHSAMAAAVKNSSGSAGSGGVLGTLTSLTAPATAEAAARTDALEKVFGGQIPFLGPGEELQLLTSSRPSAVFTGFLDWLVRDIALGFGLPMEYVWKIVEAGGANTRFILDEAQIFFDSVGTMIIDRWSQTVRERLLGSAMKNGRLSACKDPEWARKVHWQRPGKGSVDRGREAQSDIALMDKGMLNFGDYYGRIGEDGERKAEETIREKARMKKRVAEIAREEGVELTYAEVFNAGGTAGKPGEPPSKDPTLKDKTK